VIISIQLNRKGKKREGEKRRKKRRKNYYQKAGKKWEGTKGKESTRNPNSEGGIKSKLLKKLHSTLTS